MSGFFFQILHLASTAFIRKKLKLIQLIQFLNWRPEENLVVNNKDNRVFMSRNYRSDSCPWKFDVLKTSIFALEASLPQENICFKNIKFPPGNYQPIVPRQKHSSSSRSQSLYHFVRDPLGFSLFVATRFLYVKYKLQGFFVF